MTWRASRSIGVVVVVWVGAVLALCATRPDLGGSPTSWPADDVAYGAAWLIGTATTAWLTMTALASTTAFAWRGIGRVRGGLRWAIAGQALRATLAGSLAVAPPSPPVTLHVGPDGRLAPGVRPASPPSTTTTTVPSTSPRVPIPTSRTPTTRVHRVEAGDNLWTIARAALARRDRRVPLDRDIAPYWLRVIAANHTTLRSGDPNLIYPGEIVELPNP